jgi:glycosyltransferase involved in cell wall biosynthesis
MSSTMHVVVNGWFWDQPETGSGQYVRNCTGTLARLAPDVHITVIVPVDKSHGPSRLAQDGLAAPCDLRRVNCDLGDWGKLRFEQFTFPRMCRELRADLAHVPYWGSPLNPGVPTVVSILDIIPLLLPDYRGGPLVRAYTGLVKASAQNATLVLTISESSRRDVVNHLGIPKARVRVTYLAADARYTPRRDVVDEAALRQHHPDLPQGYVLYLGGLDARKNIETLLQVYTWAESTLGQDYPLVIAGTLPDGGRRHTGFFRDPRAIAKALDIEEVVRCIGPVAEEDKPALYRGASAFLYPTRYEGFGLPALEALACGVPVVGSNASSVPEIVGAGGMLVDPDDARAMAGSLIAVVTEHDLHEKLAQAALEQAARFSWEKCARETLLAYQAALAIANG